MIHFCLVVTVQFVNKSVYIGYRHCREHLLLQAIQGYCWCDIRFAWFRLSVLIYVTGMGDLVLRSIACSDLGFDWFNIHQKLQLTRRSTMRKMILLPLEWSTQPIDFIFPNFNHFMFEIYACQDGLPRWSTLNFWTFGLFIAICTTGYSAFWFSI